MEIIGNICMFIGLLLCLIGSICILLTKNFKQKLLLCSIIDSCGLLTFSLGVIFHNGISFMSFKVILVLFIAIVMFPITSNKIAYSAFYNKIREEGE